MVSLAIGAALAFGTVSVPAYASDTVGPQVCEPSGTQYTTTQYTKYIGNSSTRVYGASGGTLTISAGKQTTVSGSLQGTASAEAGVIFAKASASVGISIGLSKTVTVTNSYSWKVPASQSVGWIELGSAGYQITWSKGYYSTPCVWNRTGGGTILGATSSPYFAHS